MTQGTLELILREPYSTWQRHHLEINNVKAINYPTRYLFLLALKKSKSMTKEEILIWQCEVQMIIVTKPLCQ